MNLNNDFHFYSKKDMSLLKIQSSLKFQVFVLKKALNCCWETERQTVWKSGSIISSEHAITSESKRRKVEVYKCLLNQGIIVE